MPTPKAQDDGNKEFPVPAAVFMQSLDSSPNEVWKKWIEMQHGRENHTMTEWHSLLDSYRNQPAY